MDALRMMRGRTLQQLLHTRPLLRNNLQQLQQHISLQSRQIAPASRSSVRSLHTRIKAPPARARSFFKPFQQTTRRFATATEAPTEKLTLSGRLKKLSREYGWTAVGVYLFLSALDFPFCFLFVRTIGVDRVGHWEHVVVSTIKEWVKWPFGQETQQMIDGAVHEVQSVVKKQVPVGDVKETGEKRILEEDSTYVVVDHGYNEANKAASGSNASIWTQLALAYAIHKSFIFIRVPLTAAVLPKVVKTLRSWGYNIGKMPAKKIRSSGTSSGSAAGPSGVNTKGSGVKSD